MKFLLFFILLLGTLNNAVAFTTKKREPTRTAFKALNKKEDSPSSGSNTVTAATASGNAAALAFAPYVAYDLSQEEDDEAVIGYGTAIISCALSLALGFGLGYGT